jgi:hypothetical protein
LGDDVKLNLDELKADGEPIDPRNNANKFIRQCGVTVRDNVPITVREWHKPKEVYPEVTYVDERMKFFLWDMLMEHFNLPNGLTDRQVLKVKEFALKKMPHNSRAGRKDYGLTTRRQKSRLQNSLDYTRI